MQGRTVNTKAIIMDIKSGMGDIPIMEKYNLSPAEYLKVLEKLAAVSAITETIKQERKHSVAEASRLETKRKLPRNYALFSIAIHDAADLSVAGELNDITERGLQTSGIPARIDETKTLVIRSDVFTIIPPLVITAVCRWVGSGSTDQVAGFEITTISRNDMTGLRSLIKELTISPAGGR